MIDSSTSKPKLLDQVRNILRTKHYSLNTEKSYVNWIKRFILFHNKRHPKDMGAKAVNQFLSYLAVEEHVSASTQNQALCAIVFLYKHVLNKELGDLGNVIWAKKPEKLPVVFTRKETKVVLKHLTDVKWIMGNLLYGSGLRLMECLRLRVKDIDFGYKEILVRDGKGEKDRITMLPTILEEPLKNHLIQRKILHEDDLEKGFGTVYLPYALDRKYPNANKEWIWQPVGC